MSRIRKTLNKPFFRNVAILTSGTAAAQMIALLSSPVITRLYGPEAFGLMGTFMAIAQIFIPIAALTYPVAIVLPKDDYIAKRTFTLSIIITSFSAIIVAFLIITFNQAIVDLFHLEEVSSYLLLIPLVIIFSGFMQSLEQWLIRTKQFRINAKVAFLQSFITNSSKISVGIFYPAAAVLIVLSAFANGLRAILMYLYMRKSEYKIETKETDQYIKLITLAKQLKDFPLYRAPEVFINSLSQRFPILMLTIFFGPLSAGFYLLGNTVLQQPILLLGKSIGDVFYGRISEASHNKENLSRLIIKATFALAIIGIIPFSIIIVLGPWLFSVFFGEEWLVAGKYAQWMSVFLFFELINKPSVRSLPVLSMQFFHLISTITILIARITSLFIGFYVFSSDIMAIALFSISSALLNLLLILITIKRSASYYKKL